jgi:predicted N-acyltransferase
MPLERDVVAIETIESLADVEPSEWNRLAGRRVLASYGWLRTLDETGTNPMPSRYVLARNGSGLVGAIVCQIQESVSEAFDLDDMLFGRLAKATRRIGLSVLPAMVCGSWVGAGQSVLIRGGTAAAERQRLVVELVQGVEQVARGSGWGVCFRGVAETEPSVAEVLAKRGYLRSGAAW